MKDSKTETHAENQRRLTLYPLEPLRQ